METQALIRYWNVCAVDATEFFTVDVASTESGMRAFMSASGEVAFVDVDRELIAIEMGQLVQIALQGRRLSEERTETVLNELFARAADPSPTDARYTTPSAVPCPNCGSRLRKLRRPANEPIRVRQERMRYRHWSRLSRDEKLSLVASVLREAEEDRIAAA